MINQQIEKYRIIRLIGEGGMAKVYEAIHTRIGSRVAIKILNEELVRKTNIRHRFENEARIMAELNHPNIVNIIDYVDNDIVLAIVMEFLQGVTLTDYIRSKGKLSKQEIIQIFKQILSAFNLAHQKGIIHRDIKPSNIFIETHNNNNVKILDFGIAKLISSDLSITNSGAQMGSPLYMSPEQVKDSSNLDNLSDIYSLGVVLYHMVTGQKPYNDTTLSRFDIFNKIVYEPLPQLTEFTDFNHLIQKATQKNPSLRYATCQEFARDLEALNSRQIISNVDKRNTTSFKDVKKSPEKVSRTGSSKQVTRQTRPITNKKKTVRKKVKRKKQKKSNASIYILLVLMLLVIGVAGYFIFFTDNIEQYNNKNNTKDIVVENNNDGESPVVERHDFDVVLDYNTVATSVVETDDENYVVVGYKRGNVNQSWSKYVQRDGSTDNWKIKAMDNVILSDIKKNNKGELVVAGYTEGNSHSLIIGKYNNRKKVFFDDISVNDKNLKINSLALDDDNYIVAGYTKKRGKREEPYIAKISGKNRKLKVSNITGGKRKDIINSVTLSKDSYLFAGEKSSKIWIVKTDKNLNKLWEKTYDFGKKANDIIQYKGEIYIVGEVFSESKRDIDLFLLKVDKQGNKVYFKKFGNKDYFETKPYLTIKNDEIIVTATQTGENNKNRILILMTDLDGKKKTVKYLTKNNLLLSTKGVLRAKDNGLLILIQEETINHNESEGTESRLVKIYLD